MAEISASMVMDLRQRTGLGMMECKKALTEAAGDPAKAEELLRIRWREGVEGGGPHAAEGIIGFYVAPDADGGAGRGETRDDFVAKNDDFRAFASEVAAIVARENPADIAALVRRRWTGYGRVPPRRVVQKIGRTSRSAVSRAPPRRPLASYVHGGKIGVLPT
jgi:elongation factor Ts